MSGADWKLPPATWYPPTPEGERLRLLSSAFYTNPHKRAIVYEKGGSSGYKYKNAYKEQLPMYNPEVIAVADEKIAALEEAHEKVANAYSIKEVHELPIVERLTMAHQLMSDRVANEALILATIAPPTVMTKQDRIERDIRIDDLKVMLFITKHLRDIARDMKKDNKEDNYTEYSLVPAEPPVDENKAHIDDAREALAQLGITFDDPHAAKKKKKEAKCQDASTQ